MIYHIKNEYAPRLLQRPNLFPPRQAVEPIMFLCRLMSSAESRYWPTELEVADLVWVLGKIRHLIEFAKLPTIVYTDHGASLAVAKQISLATSSTDKLNLRLFRASDHIPRFDLVIRHKPGRLHLMPDALSRLPTKVSSGFDQEGELDILFTVSMAEMSDDFRKKFIPETSYISRWDLSRPSKSVI